MLMSMLALERPMHNAEIQNGLGGGTRSPVPSMTESMLVAAHSSSAKVRFTCQ